MILDIHENTSILEFKFSKDNSMYDSILITISLLLSPIIITLADKLRRKARVDELELRRDWPQDSAFVILLIDTQIETRIKYKMQIEKNVDQVQNTALQQPITQEMVNEWTSDVVTVVYEMISPKMIWMYKNVYFDGREGVIRYLTEITLFRITELATSHNKAATVKRRAEQSKSLDSIQEFTKDERCKPVDKRTKPTNQ